MVELYDKKSGIVTPARIGEASSPNKEDSVTSVSILVGRKVPFSMAMVTKRGSMSEEVVLVSFSMGTQ